MSARKRERLACGAIALGSLVLGGAAYALKDGIIERWHIARLGADDYAERFDAARILGDLRSTRAIPELIALLEDAREHTAEAREVWGPRVNSSRCMTAVLAGIGPAVVPALAEALEASDGKIEFWRRSACTTLREIGTDSALEALIARVDDGDGCVGLIAVQGLRSMGPRAIGAVPALTTALRSEKAYIRTAASKALEAIQGGDKAAEVPAP